MSKKTIVYEIYEWWVNRFILKKEQTKNYNDWVNEFNYDNGVFNSPSKEEK